jgi:hypothetical protein
MDTNDRIAALERELAELRETAPISGRYTCGGCHRTYNPKKAPKSYGCHMCPSCGRPAANDTHPSEQ